MGTFADLTGWRIGSEILPLQWRQVDFQAGTVRLDVGTTKNRDGREFPFDVCPELRDLLEHQRAITRAVEQQRGQIVPWVFHRNGRPIRSFYRSWHAACEQAECPSRIPHDFRRTAVRNLVRAGVPERVAMMLTGHNALGVRAVQHREWCRPSGRCAQARPSGDGYKNGYNQPIWTGSALTQILVSD